MKNNITKFLILVLLALSVGCGSDDDENNLSNQPGGVGGPGQSGPGTPGYAGGMNIGRFGYSLYQGVMYWDIQTQQTGIDFEIQFQEPRSGQWYGLIDYLCNGSGTVQPQQQAPQSYDPNTYGGGGYGGYGGGYGGYGSQDCDIVPRNSYVQSYDFYPESVQYNPQTQAVGHMVSAPSYVDGLRLRIRACTSIGSQCGAWKDRDYSNSNSGYRY